LNPDKNFPKQFENLLGSHALSRPLNQSKKWEEVFHFDGTLADNSDIFVLPNSSLAIKHNYDSIKQKISQVVAQNIVNYFEDKEYIEYDMEQLLATTPAVIHLNEAQQLHFTPDEIEIYSPKSSLWSKVFKMMI